jgi:membrane-associated PAP2 superfamily phosphatase
MTLPNVEAMRSRWREPIMLLLAFAALLCWDASGLDLLITRLVADAQGFPLRHMWLTHKILHTGGKIFYGVCIVLLAINYWKPLTAWRVDRVTQRWWFLTMFIAIAAIALIKDQSSSSCPWDLREFGGVALHLSHWNFFTSDGGPGRCFPSGHLSGAFSLLAVHFALRPVAPELARRLLWGILLLAVVLGAGQVLRGAHYVSHVFYSGWISWAICLASARLQARFRSQHLAQT